MIKGSQEKLTLVPRPKTLIPTEVPSPKRWSVSKSDNPQRLGSWCLLSLYRATKVMLTIATTFHDHLAGNVNNIKEGMFPYSSQ